MAKKIQVNLEFKADTNAAKQSVQQLQQQLNDLINNTYNKPLGLSQSIQEAATSAMTLKTALNQATNQTTGKLNLNKFQAQLNQSGKTLQQYAQELARLGPEGQKAFSNISQAIIQADSKVFSLQGGLKKLSDTFFNTVRWQMTASAISAVTSSISETVNFAKELDTSLNNIRIVTGKSSTEMEKFAKQAQQAAKSLSTGTTDYTNASLIYYQQGLSDSEVKERTETTIRLANVVGESAETVSEWMTAIWNNFDDGSKNLEYYADVLTKLGAATASSADEIAGGLEKFAAIANTVGLSYEYAASALATITAETRQSEDVVGTSLKTIFSRMESLELGDTLDDGTTLGQYSLALKQVGINIKDTNGELRDMDEILSLTGERWASLSRDEQVALSQSVAGIRQYSQFIALMDNWGTMKDNLKIAEGAAGSLASQQAIYEDSVVASQERMQAALEGVKSSLLQADDMKDVYDTLENLISFGNKLIDSFGGLKTIILGAAAALTTFYQPQIANFMSQLWVGMKSFVTMGTASVGNSLKHQAVESMVGISVGNTNSTTEKAYAQENLEIQEKIEAVEKNMGEIQKNNVQWLQQQVKAQQEKTVELEKQSILLREQAEQGEKALISSGANQDVVYATTAKARAHGITKTMGDAIKSNVDYGKTLTGEARTNMISTIGTQVKTFTENEDIKSYVKEEDTSLALEELNRELNESTVNLDNVSAALEKFLNALNAATTTDFEKIVAPTNDKMLSNKITDARTLQKRYKESGLKDSGLESEIESLANDRTRIEGEIKEQKAIPETSEHYAAAQKKLKSLNEELDENKEATSNTVKKVNDEIKARKDAATVTQDQANDLEDLAKGAEEAGKAQGETLNGVATTEATTAELNEQLNNAYKSSSEGLAEMGAGAVQAATGMSMLTSAVSQAGQAIGSASFSWSGLTSGLTSGLMGLTTVASGVKTLRSGLNALVSGMNKTKAISKQLTKEDKANAFQRMKAFFSAAFGKAAEDAAWGNFATVATIVALAAAVGFNFVSGINQGKTQKKEEQLQKDTQNLEAIKENQGLSESLDEVIDKYKSLKNAGASTADTFEEINTSTEKVIDSYKELTTTLGKNLDTSQLEKALEYFNLTGDTSLLEEAQEELEEAVTSAQMDTARSAMNNATDLAVNAALEGQGRKRSGGYTFHIGDAGISEADETAVKEIFEEELGDDLWNSDTGYFKIADRSNSAEVISAYTKMVAARDRLLQQGLKETDYYRELNEEIEQFSEHMEDAISASNTYYEQSKKQALEDEISFIAENDIQEIQTYADYVAKRDDILDKLMESQNWTEEQAKDYLSSSSLFGNFEDTLSFLGTDGTAKNLTNFTAEKLKELQEWYAGLDEDSRSLALNIDFSLISSTDQAIDALQELRETAERSGILQDAEQLSVDKNTFETYTEGLVQINPLLEEDSVLSEQIALNNLKISKGLETLTKNWSKNFEILSNGNKATLEYAESIGEIKTALEEMFGVTPSTEFVEKYADDISDMVNGNKDKIETIQNAIADDYIKNMDIVTLYSQNTGEKIGAAADEARNALFEMLNGFDTSLEVGEGTTLSGDFLETVQQMLDASQITQDELENLFRAKGYELNIDSWKMVDGEERTITKIKLDKDGNPTDEVESYTEKTKIKVPVINGHADDISVKSSPSASGQVTVTKSTDKRVISSKTTEDNKENLESSKKRYHEIKELLSDIERELDLISEAKDRAFGAQHLAYLDQEISKQQQLNAAQEEYLRQAQEYYWEDRDKLLSSYGVQLDDAGRITNFTQIQEGITNKDKLSDFQKLVDNYEESLNLVEEQQQKIIQGQYELHDLALEKIEYKIEFKIDVDQFTLDSLEHQLSRIEDKAFAAAKKIALIGKSMEIAASQIKTYTEGIEGILGNAFSSSQVSQIMSGNLSGIDITQLTDDDLEKLKEYGSSLTEVETTLREQHTQVHEALTETIEDWNEEFDRNMSKFDQYNSIIENYKNIIDIVGKDNLGISNDMLRQMYATQKQVANDQLAAAKARKESAEDAYAQLEAQYNNAVSLYGKNSEIALAWKQQMLDAEDTLIDATSDFQDAWQNAVQTAADTFANSVDLIIEEFESSISGIYGTLSALQEHFDQQSEISDRYLENYEKTYEINKLNRKITQDIAKTTNTKSQKELRDLQSDLLEMSEEGNKVSQRDIEFMQKKYDLLLAEQALRDAQNAKSVVRLKRDSEGNYGYVYTADQTAVNEAQQAYEDARYNLEKWNEETLTTISEQIITIEQAFAQAIQDIANDTTLSDEERKVKMAETTAYYVGQLEYWTNEAERLNQNISEANSQFHMDMADSIHDTLIGQLFPDLDNWTDLYTNNSAAMEDASADLSKAIVDMADDIEDAMEDAGTSVDDFKGDVQDDLKNVRTAASNTASKVADMKNDMSSALTEATNAVSGFESSWSSYMGKVKSAVDSVTKAIEEMLIAASKTSNVTVDGSKYTNSGLGGNGSDGNGKNPNDQTNTTGKATTGQFKSKDSLKADETTYYKLDNGNWYAQENLKAYSDGTYDITGGARKWQFNESISFKNDKEYNERKHVSFSDWQGLYGDEIDFRDKNGKVWKTNHLAKTGKISDIFDYASVTGYSKDLVNGMRLYKVQLNSSYPGNLERTFYISQGELNSLLGNTSGFQAYKAYNLTPFDTGGYTGAWGPEGKLAVLHQKELVLNKDETQDFLTAINLLREMQINVPTTQVVSPSIAPTAETIQQEVHITAEFPNATNHSEIEEAFRNLNNYATQYVNRKS